MGREGIVESKNCSEARMQRTTVGKAKSAVNGNTTRFVVDGIVYATREAAIEAKSGADRTGR